MTLKLTDAGGPTVQLGRQSQNPIILKSWPEEQDRG